MRKHISLGALIAAAAACVATMPAIALPSFNDVFWQIAEGREILAGHIPTTVPSAISAGTWVDHEWLFEALAAWTYDHHCYAVLVALCALAGAVIPLCIFASARLEHDEFDIGAGLAAVCSVLIMCKYDAVRPLQFGAAACAILFLLLRKKEQHIGWYFLLAVVWANFHASIVLAPAVCAIFYLSARVSAKAAAARTYAKAFVAMLAGSLCTPSSFALYTYAFAHIGLSGSSTQIIAEWNPFAFHSFFDALAVGTILLAVAAVWQRKDLPLAERIASALFIVLALHQQRQLAFLTAGCAGCIARVIPTRYSWSIRRSTFHPAIIGLAIATVLVQLPTLLKADPLGLDHDLQPLFAHMPRLQNPVNAYVDYDIAGYTEMAGAPLRILIDSHADCFSSDVFADWQTLVKLTPGWQQVLSRRQIHIVVIAQSAALAQALTLLPQWHVVTASGNYVALTDRSLSKSSTMLSVSPMSMRSDDTRSRASDTRFR